MICIKCNLPDEYQLIKNPCGTCDDHIHIKCVMKHQYCITCNNKYDYYKCPRGRLNLPKLNIYTDPLVTCYYIEIDKNNKFRQLAYASIYLCVDRVKEILKTISKDEFIDMIENVHNYDEYGTYFRLANSGLKLTPFLPTNLNNHRDLILDINLLLFKKKIDIMEYECNYETKIDFGNYKWCFAEGKYKLTNMVDSYMYMLKLTLNPNQKLKIYSKFYKIYTENDVEIKTSSYEEMSEKNTIEFIKIKPEMLGTKIKIAFSKDKELSLEENEFIKKHFIRMPTEEIYIQEITIPELIQYGNTSECNICFEPVLMNNKYIKS